MFRERDAFDGAFLGIGGLISGDGEGVRVEGVLAGILGGADFAFGGGTAGVGAVGGEWHWSSSSMTVEAGGSWGR